MFDIIRNKIKRNNNSRLIFIDLEYNSENIDIVKEHEKMIDYNSGHIYIKNNDNIISKTKELEDIINSKISNLDVDKDNNLIYKNNIIWDKGNLNPDNYLLKSGGILNGNINFNVSENYNFIDINDWKLNYQEDKLTFKNNETEFIFNKNGKFNTKSLYIQDNEAFIGDYTLKFDNNILNLLNNETTVKVSHSKEAEYIKSNDVVLQPSGYNKLNIGIKSNKTKLYIGKEIINGTKSPSTYIFNNGNNYSDIECGSIKSNKDISIIGEDNHFYLPNNSYIKTFDSNNSICNLIGSYQDDIILGANNTKLKIKSNVIDTSNNNTTIITNDDIKIEIKKNDNPISIKNNDIELIKLSKSGILNVLSGINIGGIIIKKNQEDNTLDFSFE